MRFMLDTNIISDMIRNPAGKAASAMVREGDARCLHQHRRRL